MAALGGLLTGLGLWLLSWWAMGERATRLIAQHEVIRLFADEVAE
ncbi:MULTISPECIES: hypothetical protein [unclassified Lacticaseibacillus]|nr:MULTISPECIES: hypothetical protein [unclassified Lacticaseibacillus]